MPLTKLSEDEWTYRIFIRGVGHQRIVWVNKESLSTAVNQIPSLGYETWSYGEELHRLDGPAVTDWTPGQDFAYDGDELTPAQSPVREWYLHGLPYTEAEHRKVIEEWKASTLPWEWYWTLTHPQTD